MGMAAGSVGVGLEAMLDGMQRGESDRDRR